MICLHGKLRVEDLARRPSQLSSTELAERAESARTQLKTDPDCHLKNRTVPGTGVEYGRLRATMSAWPCRTHQKRSV